MSAPSRPLEFPNLNAILDFAIEEEKKARDFYLNLANRAVDPAMKAALVEFSREELGHQQRLERIRAGALFQKILAGPEKIAELGFSDYLRVPEVSAEMTYTQILIVAMHKEKAAYHLYTDLASLTDDPQLRDTLLGLAREEARHKLSFELEYDRVNLSEN